MKWLDNIPLLMIALPAFLLAISPIGSEPHLIEKLRMLSEGTLKKPIDIFDLLLHSVPLVILALKLVRMLQQRRQG